MVRQGMNTDTDLGDMDGVGLWSDTVRSSRRDAASLDGEDRSETITTGRKGGSFQFCRPL